MSISEITGMDENVISMQEIFSFPRKGIGPNGNVIGAFRPSGIRPKFLERLRVAGIHLPATLFEGSMEVAEAEGMNKCCFPHSFSARIPWLRFC